MLLLKKMENYVFQPKTSFCALAAHLVATVEARGSGAIRTRRWGDLPQGVGQIAPPPSGSIFERR